MILPLKLDSKRSIFNWKPPEEEVQFATGICITGILYSIRYEIRMIATIYIIIIIISYYYYYYYYYKNHTITVLLN
jgi:hypothetical protein